MTDKNNPALQAFLQKLPLGSTPPEIIPVVDDQAICDGGAEGHPRIYVPIGKDGFAPCGYCGRIYVRAAGKKAAAH